MAEHALEAPAARAVAASRVELELDGAARTARYHALASAHDALVSLRQSLDKQLVTLNELNGRINEIESLRAWELSPRAATIVVAAPGLVVGSVAFALGVTLAASVAALLFVSGAIALGIIASRAGDRRAEAALRSRRRTCELECQRLQARHDDMAREHGSTWQIAARMAMLIETAPLGPDACACDVPTAAARLRVAVTGE